MKATLYTKAGKKVGTVDSMAVEIMFKNNNPPEILVWGDRTFHLTDEDKGVYVEGLAWYLTDQPNNRMVLD